MSMWTGRVNAMRGCSSRLGPARALYLSASSPMSACPPVHDRGLSSPSGLQMQRDKRFLCIFSIFFATVHSSTSATHQPKKRRLPESEDLMRPSNAKRTVENDGQVQRQQGAVASFLSLEAHRFVLASDDKKATVSPDGWTIRLRSLDQWLNQGRRSRSVLRHRHRHLPATT